MQREAVRHRKPQKPVMRRDARPWAWLAGLAIVALLFGFDRVVQRIVDQGEGRRSAERERSSATWRCGSLASRQDRAECRAALR